MPTKKSRVSLTMSDALVAQVERYQRYHRFATRSRAVLSLVKLGLRFFPSVGTAQYKCTYEDGVFFEKYLALDSYGKKAALAIVEIELKRMNDVDEGPNGHETSVLSDSI